MKPSHFAKFTEEINGMYNPPRGERESSLRTARRARSRTVEVLEAQGEFFRCPAPMYHHNRTHRIIPCQPDATAFRNFVADDLGIIRGEKPYGPIVDAILDSAMSAPLREVSKFAHFANGAVYLNTGQGLMLKVTAFAIEEVPVGTDGVLLTGDDVVPFASLPVLEAEMNRLRPIVGNRCITPCPHSPMAEMFTSRWSTDSALSPAQAHGLFLSRLMFLTVANTHRLWPLLLLTGEQGSGKSTPLEALQTFLSGQVADCLALPSKIDDLLVTLSHYTWPSFDNCDSAIKSDELSNFLCLLSTGAVFNRRKLYSDGDLDSRKVKAHAAFTARVNPFGRSDVMRRVLVLETAVTDQNRNKSELLQRVAAERTTLMAEFLLRTQNIVRAMQDVSDIAPTESQLDEYASWTMRCARFEGTEAHWADTWSASAGMFRSEISDGNSLVQAFRWWLGENPARAGQPISPTLLYTEVRNVHLVLGHKLPFTNAAAFGKNIGNSMTSLRSVGCSTRRSHGKRSYLFEPTPEVLTDCRTEYEALLAREEATQLARAGVTNQGTRDSSGGRVNSRTTGFDLHKEDADDTSDIDSWEDRVNAKKGTIQ